MEKKSFAKPDDKFVRKNHEFVVHMHTFKIFDYIDMN